MIKAAGLFKRIAQIKNACFNFYTAIKWAMSWENLFLPYATNKGADKPAHPRSLISACVVRSLDSTIPLVSISKISSLYLASVAAQAGLSLPWPETSKTGFVLTRLKLKQKRERHSLYITAG